MSDALDSSGLNMAMWYSPALGSAAGTAKATLHFNLWHYDKSSFLDIGLLVTGHSKIQDIFLYLPAKFEQSNVSDLAHKLKHQEILVGIFNEPYSPQENNHHIYINQTNPQGRFAVAHCLTPAECPVSHELANTPIDGTIIKITQAAVARARTLSSVNTVLTDDENIYFRIRVIFPTSKKNPFVSDVQPSWERHLMTGYDLLRFVDFRMNELRNLPDEIAREITSVGHHHFEINEVHFLFVTEAKSDFVGGQQSHKCRMLEPDIWSKYVESDKRQKGLGLPPLPNHMIIYHSKKTTFQPANPDFNAFLKFRIRKSNWITIIIYLLFVLLLGIFTNRLSDTEINFPNPAEQIFTNSVDSSPKADNLLEQAAKKKPSADGIKER